MRHGAHPFYFFLQARPIRGDDFSPTGSYRPFAAIDHSPKLGGWTLFSPLQLDSLAEGAGDAIGAEEDIIAI